MTTSIKVNPGICGFPATVFVEKVDNRCARVSIISDCLQVTSLSAKLPEIRMVDLFKPVHSSMLYACVADCSLHPSCAVPLAIIKAVECEFGLALPKNVTLEFIKQ